MWSLFVRSKTLRQHNSIAKQLCDGFFPKTEAVIKKKKKRTMIVYNCLLKLETTMHCSTSVLMNGISRNQRRILFIYMTLGPTERSQGFVSCCEGWLLLNGHYRGELWSFVWHLVLRKVTQGVVSCYENLLLLLNGTFKRRIVLIRHLVPLKVAKELCHVVRVARCCY